MEKPYNKILLITICILFFTPSAAYLTIAEETILSKREINADSLRWEYEAKIAVFSGNVVTNGEEGEICCPKMTVFFNEEDEIKKMLAEGTATLIRDKQKGGGEIIEIYPSDNLIILKDDAWISSDKALFRGEEIIFDTTTEVINITKGVKGEIQTGSNKE